MHKTFFPLFAISLLGVLASSFFQHGQYFSQMLSLLFGILPLCLYHISLSKKTELSSTEVDSVYYFGFLVTVITLISTALSIGIAQTALDLRWILFQFGLGLIATGYALFARLLLANKSASQVEINIVDSSRQLVESVSRVAGKFDEAGFHTAAFVEHIQERLDALQTGFSKKLEINENRFAESLSLSLEKFNTSVGLASNASLQKCAESIDFATQTFSKAISSVTVEVHRLQTEAEVISFAKAAERIDEFSLQMESSIGSITNNLSETSLTSAQSIAELGATSRKVNKLAIDIAAKLEKLQQLEVLTQAIIDVSDSLSRTAKAADGAHAAFDRLGKKSDAHIERMDAEFESRSVGVNLTRDQVNSHLLHPLKESSVMHLATTSSTRDSANLTAKAIPREAADTPEAKTASSSWRNWLGKS
ncbi:MAG: hypothetical protein RLY95_1141 [Pseudomonadota bacterium]